MNNGYRARLNRAIEYIDEHIGDKLDLETVAGIAAFSKYHFHRVFSSMVGEPLGAYIQRLRLEKAAAGCLKADISAMMVPVMSYI